MGVKWSRPHTVRVDDGRCGLARPVPQDPQRVQGGPAGGPVPRARAVEGAEPLRLPEGREEADGDLDH